MPTESTTQSRTLRMTRKFATRSGEKPVVSKTIAQVAPKAGVPVAKPAVAADWMPSDDAKRALASAGRRALPKAVVRTAAAIASTGAPTVVRTVFATSDDRDALVLSLALGASEATAAGKSVVVVVSDEGVELAEAIQLKYAALFPSGRPECVLAKTSDETSRSTADASGAVVFPADTAAASGAVAPNFDVAVVVSTGSSSTQLTALRSVAQRLQSKRVVVVGSNVKQVTGLNVAVGGKADAADAKRPKPETVALRNLELHFFVVQGLGKFKLLQSLVQNSGATKKILVRFSTKEVASFYCDVLYAMNAKAVIFSDVEVDAAFVDGPDEGAPAGSSAAPVDVPVPGVPAAHHLRSVVDQFESAPSGCVLLSAFGLSSRKADVVVDFDPPADLGEFIASTMRADSNDSGAETHLMMFEPTAHAAAIAAMKYHARALVSSHAQQSAAAEPSKKASQSEASKKKKQPAKEEAAPDAGKAPGLRFARLPTPSAADTAIAGSKLKSLGKKLFQLGNKGYLAFRSFMHFYALLRPSSVFDVYQLDFQAVAEQFGLDEAPLLDLRTKSNSFRPKEDFNKFAEHREREERRAFRDYARENIVGEGPDAEDA